MGVLRGAADKRQLIPATTSIHYHHAGFSFNYQLEKNYSVGAHAAGNDAHVTIFLDMALSAAAEVQATQAKIKMLCLLVYQPVWMAGLQLQCGSGSRPKLTESKARREWSYGRRRQRQYFLAY